MKNVFRILYSVIALFYFISCKENSHRDASNAENNLELAFRMKDSANQIQITEMKAQILALSNELEALKTQSITTTQGTNKTIGIGWDKNKLDSIDLNDPEVKKNLEKIFKPQDPYLPGSTPDITTAIPQK